jgi:radical SAM protein with 4Fe4S-binding SPASM domain
MAWNPFRSKLHALNPEFVAQSKHFCIMPWVHLHITQQGTVTPCCQAPWEEAQAFGQIDRQDIHEIWADAPMRAFRSRLRADQPDSRCTRCYEKEASGSKSFRQRTNGDYLHQLGRAASDTPPPPIYLDIRFSNLCNLKCRICGPWSSSQWHADAVALGMVAASSPALTFAAKDEDALFAQLEPILPEVEELYFAGGEPLFMEQHYRLLDRLIAHGNTRVHLKYNTNFSKLGIKHWKASEYWRQFPHVTLSASLDGAEARGTYLRKGLDWDAVVDLRRELQAAAPHVHFVLSPTAYVFNVLHLPDFHQDWVAKGLIGAEDFFPSLLIQPEPYNIRVLPPGIKAQVVTRYQAHLIWLQGQVPFRADAHAESLRQFQAVIDHIQSGDHSHLLPDFQARTARLDRLRGEQAAAVFPELWDLW